MHISLPFRPNKKLVLTEDEEKKLQKLEYFDTVFLLDDSGSMSEPLESQGHTTRWKAAKQALCDIAEIAARYDQDGIDIELLNSTTANSSGIRNKDGVRTLFRKIGNPWGGTPLGKRLSDIFTSHIKKMDEVLPDRPKRLNLIVITDGQPNDQEQVKDVIIQCAKSLQFRNATYDVGIQFVQIGDDLTATEFLKMLDDELTSNSELQDIVDTVKRTGKFSSESLLKALLGGVDRNVDETTIYTE